MPEKFTNRLIHEKSPYLLQHAHNPVDWYPWGDEAFSAAVRHNKPIFLSIGYATCHWCHVMEENVFSNAEIANKMNDLFICIKVDREERPDVDSLYMDFAQALMTGNPGWPLNVILTPELYPFFAATYLPPKSMRGVMGMEELMVQIEQVWESEQQDQIVLQGEQIVKLFEENTRPIGDDLPHEEIIHEVAETFFHEADPVWGGLRGSPKFPMGYHSTFLLHYYAKYRETRALFWVEKTLQMMQRGGIYDRLEGGFHRYSIDQMWETPHFEKMLYDNAFLANAYLEAWQLTKKDEYQQICEKTLRYILTTLRDPETGAFYSAQDADIEGVEGKYYTWTYDEVKDILGPDDCTIFCEYYGVVVEGNV
ncbi:MAG: thioredoxin domain-containing protein, partial [Waddliaceae bacterium]